MKQFNVLAGLLTAGLVFTPGTLMAQAAAAPTAPAVQSPEVARMKAELADWPALAHYAAANAALPPAAPGVKRVVFMGDSITDVWGRLPDTGTFFPGKPYVDRGISGQTTPQMLVRFTPDVVRLHPAVVVLLGGTNDVAGNTGPTTTQAIEDNYAAMVAIAQQNGIKVVLASITPAYAYPWKPGVAPVAEILQLNAWLKEFAAGNHCVYLDYYSAMADAKGAMLPGLAKDGVHPTTKGYDVMAPLAEKAIAEALGQ